MIRAFVDPNPGALVSPAMYRVAEALRRFSPKEIRVVDAQSGEECDLHVLHVIGPYPMTYIRSKDYVVIQYCYKTAGEFDWRSLWSNSKLIWSYYDLPVPEGTRYFHGPLGVDGSVFNVNGVAHRDIGVVTSGYVASPGEAIEEVADAALESGLSVFHLGPADVVGMARRKELTWTNGQSLTDVDLSRKYQRARWVSGLRRVEGFELPVLEGAACGARPIVFDRDEMRTWFRDFAVLVPELEPWELTRALEDVFRYEPSVVSPEEREKILCRFAWRRVAEDFWKAVLA